MMRIRFKLEKPRGKNKEVDFKHEPEAFKQVKVKRAISKDLLDLPPCPPLRRRKVTDEDFLQERQDLLDFNQRINQLLPTTYDDLRDWTCPYRMTSVPEESKRDKHLSKRDQKQMTREEEVEKCLMKERNNKLLSDQMRKKFEKIIKELKEEKAPKVTFSPKPQSLEVNKKMPRKEVEKSTKKRGKKKVLKVTFSSKLQFLEENKEMPRKEVEKITKERDKEKVPKVTFSTKPQSLEVNKEMPRKGVEKSTKKRDKEEKTVTFKLKWPERKKVVPRKKFIKKEVKSEDQMIDDLFNREQRQLVVEAREKLKSVQNEIKTVLKRITTVETDIDYHNKRRQKLRKQRIILVKGKLDIIRLAEEQKKILDIQNQNRNFRYEMLYKVIGEKMGTLRKKLRKQHRDRLKMIRATVKTSKVIALVTKDIDWHDKEIKYHAEQSDKLKEEIRDLKQKVNVDCNLNVFHIDTGKNNMDAKKRKIHGPIQLPANSANFIKAFKQEYKKNQGSLPLPVQSAGPSVTKGENALLYKLKKPNYEHRLKEERAEKRIACQAALINKLEPMKTGLKIKWEKMSEDCKELAELEKHRELWKSKQEELINDLCDVAIKYVET